jgi:hypothetical protein
MVFEASLDHQLPLVKEEKTSLPYAGETRTTKAPLRYLGRTSALGSTKLLLAASQASQRCVGT